MLNTGIKISQYPDAPVDDFNKKNRLLLNHHFITYAPSHYGIKYINKNYKVSLDTLQKDIMGQIGLNNVKGKYLNYIDFWSGYWSNEDKVESYVYEWPKNLQYNDNYIPDKFGYSEDKSRDKIFLLKSAPLPLEEIDEKINPKNGKSYGSDPNPETNKFVNKKYIDDRFNGIRKVTSSGTSLEIRPYTCLYDFSTMPQSIDIVDTIYLEDGRGLKDCIENNCLIFYIKLPTPFSTSLSITHNGLPVKWSFDEELNEILSNCKEVGVNIYIKCYAEYVNNVFTVHCTNALNNMWYVKAGDFIKIENKNVISVKTTDTIIDDNTVVPTSKPLHDLFYGESELGKIEKLTFETNSSTQSYTHRDATGFTFIPKTEITLKKINILPKDNNVLGNVTVYLHIWTPDVTDNFTTVTKIKVSENHAIYENGYLSWDIGENITLITGQQYIFTFHTNSNFSENWRVGKVLGLYGFSSKNTPSPAYPFTWNALAYPNDDTSTSDIDESKEYSLDCKIYGEFEEIIEISEGIIETLDSHINNSDLHGAKHDISHKFDYNFTSKYIKSYRDGTITLNDNSIINYDIYPATIANYTFRNKGIRGNFDENTATLTSFNERVREGANGTGKNQYYYYERDYYSQKPGSSALYYDDDKDGGTAKPLSNLINGSNMFLRAKLSSFNDNISSLQIGRQMFAQNRYLKEFRSALPSLTNGDKMFIGTALTSFRTKLPSLSMAESMFRLCPHLRYVDTCLPNLTFAQGMFGLCINLQRMDLSKNSGISLYNADDMFAGCESLTHCMLDLSYLETGDNMFGKAGSGNSGTVVGNITIPSQTTYGHPKLDLKSVKFMCDTLRDWSSSFKINETIDTGNGTVNEQINTEDHKITFGIYDDIEETASVNINKAKQKGWMVTTLISPITSFTYDIDDTDIVRNLEIVDETLKKENQVNHNIYAFALSKSHFVGENETKKIKRIIINNNGAGGWTQTSGEAYMVLRFIKNGNIVGKSEYWSNNKSKFISSYKKYVFNFETIDLPVDYDVIRIALVKETKKESVTFDDNFLPDNDSRYLFRTNVLTNTNGSALLHSDDSCYCDLYWPAKQDFVVETVVQFE